MSEKEKRKIVLEYLENWFATQSEGLYSWSRDPVGKLIKDNLVHLKRWKNKNRGDNPRPKYW